MNAPAAALVGVAYLLGSISFAVLIVRMRTGRDIRSEGSGNAGATNVARAHGKALGVAVGLLDLAKGAAAVLLMRTVTADPRYTAAAGLAAIVGHIFPIFYGFRGGKGVATAIGAFLVLAPWPTLVCAGVFLLVVLVDALRLARVDPRHGPPASGRGRFLPRAPARSSPPRRLRPC